MTIIKQGKDPNEKPKAETARLECMRCGCVFEAEDDEYECTYPRNNPSDKTYKATCPNEKCRTYGGKRYIVMR